MEELDKIHVTKESEMGVNKEKAALFTDDISEKEIKSEISKQSTVAFTERERLWEGMK